MFKPRRPKQHPTKHQNELHRRSTGLPWEPNSECAVQPTPKRVQELGTENFTILRLRTKRCCWRRCCCRLQAKSTFMVIGPPKIAPSRDTAVLKARLNLARSWNFWKSSFAGKISIAKRSRCWNVKIRINFHIVRHTGIYRPRRWWRFLRTWWKDHVLERVGED